MPTTMTLYIMKIYKNRLFLGCLTLNDITADRLCEFIKPNEETLNAKSVKKQTNKRIKGNSFFFEKCVS